MPIAIGLALRRRRERARLTQQELVDHTRLDRSASYISAVETGRSSPTLAELEQLARYFRLDVLELLREAQEASGGSAPAEPALPPEDRLTRAWAALDEPEQELALEFMALLARHARRR